MADSPRNSEAFDKAYSEEGWYSRTFGDNLISPRDEDAIRNVMRSCERSNPVTIIDHGCGNGRAHYLYEEYASHKPVHVIGFDVSEIGIDAYRAKLLTRGYEENPPYHFQKGSLTVDLVYRPYGKPVTDYQHAIDEKLGGRKADIAVSEFGVISHIPTQAARVATLGMLRDLVNPKAGKLVATVPNYSQQVKDTFELEADFDTASQADRLRLGLDKRGDIIFKRPMMSGEPVLLYYHLYTPAEFKKDLITAGWQGNVTASSIQPEHEVSCRKSAMHLSDEEWAQLRDGELRACKGLEEEELGKAHYLLAVMALQQHIFRKPASNLLQ